MKASLKHLTEGAKAMTKLTLTCRTCGREFVLPEGELLRACPACGTPHSRPRAEGTALDALRRYCADKKISVPRVELCDAWGNVIAPDSPMADGRHIYTSPFC